MSDFTDFSDMDDFDNAPVRKSQVTTVEEIKCIKCAGSGKVRYGYVNISYYDCNMCKGTGKVTQARVNRYNGAKKAEVTRVSNVAKKLEIFKEANPSEFKWLQDNQHRSDFAANLLAGLMQYGSLTEKQLEAVTKSLIRNKIYKTEQAKLQEGRNIALNGSALSIHTALTKAASTGLKGPTLRTEKIKFSLAKPGSKNPGFVYVSFKTTDEYIGKISPEGVFMPTRECPDEAKQALVEVAENPLDAAIKYGRLTGSCSCCGRTLTDKDSVAMGIGPICQAKFF